MDFKNIPILRDMDFSDPAKRKNYLMIGITGVIFIVLVIVMLINNSSQKDKEIEQEKAAIENYETPDIPLGEDRDNIEGKNLRETISEGAPSATDLFSDDLVDDPLQLIEDRSRDSMKNMGVTPIQLGERDVYPEREPETVQPESQKTEDTRRRFPATETTYQGVRRPGEGNYAGGVSYEEQERLAREERTRQRMIANGINPDTGMPYNSTGTGYYGAPTQPVQQQQPPTEQVEEEPVIATPKVQVRRSGGVSSLGSGVSSAGSGVSSLGDQDQYVTEDPAHPFRVKFAYDEKITSGQRVTLRLCEDMVVDGVLIPVNTHLFATCSIGDRLSLKISSISINGKIYTLNYVAYDNDGAQGLYCPSTATAKAKNEAGREAGQIISSAVQSAVAGTAGRIVSSGAALITGSRGEQKVEVTAGYQFYIMADKH